MRKIFLFVAVFASASVGTVMNVRAQALDKLYAKSLILASGGTSISNTVTLTAPSLTTPVTITLPSTNRIGPLTNDGFGNLNWGGPTGIIAGSANQFLVTSGLLSVTWQALDEATSLTGNGITTALALNLANPNIWTAVQTVQKNSIGTTPTDGLVISNSTSATNNAQQYSPRLHFAGQGYKSSNLTSQSTDWIMQNIPVQGSATPSTRLDFENSIAGGSYSSNGFNVFPSGGATLGISSPADPGTGVFDASTGFEVGGPATSGKMLIGNGTEFVPTSYAYPTTVGAAGNILWSNGSAFVSNQVTAGQFSPSNPTGTTSTTGVMMGLGKTATFTPGGSGIILILISGYMAYTPTTDEGYTVAAQIRWGTGAAPSNGTSLAGTSAGSNIKTLMANGLNQWFFCLNAIVGGGGSPLTVGTTYWIDAAVSSPSGTVTANINNVTISVMELE